MDQTLRTLERVATRSNDDHETLLRLAAEQVRRGELVALTQVVFAPPRKAAGETCTHSRSRPRIYVLREPDSGDLTRRVRYMVLRKVLEHLGWPAVQARWTFNAGCPCGCSPGFTLRGRGAEGLGDTYVRVLVATSERDRLRTSRIRPIEPWRPVVPPPATTPPAPPAVVQHAAPIAPTLAADRRLPPAGTLLRKVDRRGRVRCEATVDATGVWFRGTRYSSLTAAALAAARSLGSAPKSLNGWAWWGLENPRAARRRGPTLAPTPAPPCSACGSHHGLLACPDVGR